MRAIFSSVTIALISVPLILRMVPPNGIYGFRAGGIRSNPDLWYEVNAFAGWAILAAAVISTVGLVRLAPSSPRWRVWLTLSLPLFAAVAVSFVYLERVR